MVKLKGESLKKDSLYLTHFRLLSQNTTDKVAKQQKCISYSSGGWEIGDQSAS